MKSFFEFENNVSVEYPIEFYNGKYKEKNNEKNSNKCANSYDIFLSNFNKKTFDLFDNFDFSNIVISGSFIVECLLDENYDNSDINMFLYDLTVENMNKKIRYVIDYINNKNILNKVVINDMNVIIFFNYPYKNIRISLNNNIQKYDCVDNIDFNLSKIIFNGEKLECNEKTFFELINNLILLNDVNINYSFDLTNQKIIKYFKRGTKICIDGYSKHNLILFENNLFDNLVFHKYYKIFDKFKSMTSVIDDIDVSFLKHEIFDMNFIKLSCIKYHEHYKLDEKNNLVFSSYSFLNKKFIDVLIEKKYINNDHELNEIVKFINTQNLDEFNVIVKKNMYQNVIVNYEDKPILSYAFINDKDFEYYEKPMTNLKKMPLTVKLKANFNEIVDNIVNSEKKIGLSNTDKIQMSRNINGIRMLLDDLVTEKQIGCILNCLLSSNIYINVNYLYYEILNYFQKYSFDEKILELYLEYFKKCGNKYFDLYFPFNELVTDSNLLNIQFFINKKISYYNIHMIDESNICYYLNNIDKNLLQYTLLDENEKICKLIHNDICLICHEKIDNFEEIYAFGCKCKYLIHTYCVKTINKCIICKK